MNGCPWIDLVFEVVHGCAKIARSLAVKFRTGTVAANAPIPQRLASTANLVAPAAGAACPAEAAELKNSPFAEDQVAIFATTTSLTLFRVSRQLQFILNGYLLNFKGLKR